MVPASGHCGACNVKSCPIRERTADGDAVGRCWYYTGNEGKCPRHGDVSAALTRFNETGELTDENDHKKGRS